jgi:hypothetical protein
MSIEKLMKRKDENIILGIRENGKSLFLFDTLPQSPHPSNPFVSSLKNKNSLFQSRQFIFK